MPRLPRRPRAHASAGAGCKTNESPDVLCRTQCILSLSIHGAPFFLPVLSSIDEAFGPLLLLLRRGEGSAGADLLRSRLLASVCLPSARLRSRVCFVRSVYAWPRCLGGYLWEVQDTRGWWPGGRIRGRRGANLTWPFLVLFKSSMLCRLWIGPRPAHCWVRWSGG